ncbi:MAG: ATP-binding protein [Bacteroidetes bacterium]|nr:ATP-binding protein [Bacteroidota bacterium]
MKKIERLLADRIKSELTEGNKIVILYGARQTGKTTLSEDVLSTITGKILRINADELRYHDVLSSRDAQKLGLLIEGYDVVFIDEAQRIPEIGINLKILHHNFPALKLLVTGSSSFDLAGKVKEPLTGRTSSHVLYPVSLAELRKHWNVFELQNRLEEFMIYGTYPGVFHFSSSHQKEKHLRELSSSYLFKDIFELSFIKNTSTLVRLLRMLALQIGSEVSLTELGQNLGISQETVSNYIDLLEQSFIIFRLGGFSRNLRKEISKRHKIYFWDLGIRNSLLNNHLGLNFRNDTGAMWENFLVAERLKLLSYNQVHASSYFWRTYTGAEIDYVEEYQGKLYAFEIKFRKAKTKPPRTWVENYGANFKCITVENFHEFVL